MAILMSNWIEVGILDESNCDFSEYNMYIGVYKAILNGKVVYIGKATELNNRGFRKRLRDYTRDNDSARNYLSGKKMYENCNEIIIEVFIVESSFEGQKEASKLEKKFIDEFKPIWNSLDKNKTVS